MKARWGKCLEALSASLWFLPSVLALLGIVAALGLVEVDRRFEPRLQGVAGILFQGGPEGARAVLSALVSSMMTVTGVTFSITVVALTLASQQYTPRVLRHFAGDRGNQVVLGTFIATFIYCLLVLRTVRADEAGRFVPHLAVTGGVVLSVISLALLIYFIHHVAASIQPSSIIRRIAATTHQLIDNLFPDPVGEDVTLDEAVAEGFLKELGRGITINSCASGYLQAVDVDDLISLATERDLVVRIERDVGDFLPMGVAMATVWPRKDPPPNLVECVNKCFALGRDRTMQHDPEYGILQLSDIGVKALSPGINDPTTAITCLHYLGNLLRHLGQREIPSPLRKDGHGSLRVIARGTTFERMADLAFSQIRLYGERDPEVLMALLRTIGEVASAFPPTNGRREVLRVHVSEIAESAQRGITSVTKCAQVMTWVERTRKALAERYQGCPSVGKELAA